MTEQSLISPHSNVNMQLLSTIYKPCEILTPKSTEHRLRDANYQHNSSNEDLERENVHTNQ